MKVLVTGATGFIGYYVIHQLLNRNAEVIATSSSEEKARNKDWYTKVKFVQYRIDDKGNDNLFSKFLNPDIIIHLAWEGLPNYKELYHFEKNLMPQYFFIRQLINEGVSNITITGTCLEYGMKEGALDVSMPTDPQNPYALAKDTLRKFLQQLQQKNKFNLKWLRLFYMYGKGQSEKSLLSQLDKAIAEKATEFNMSGGEQLRDYLPVESIASEIVDTAMDTSKNGIYNCCSGQPVSVKSLVRQYLEDKKQTIKLNLGYYPYNDYEPMAFWGVK
jgi:dTDP-6-deoxy-L-talose 4-dehydrogenase (NAD+)